MRLTATRVRWAAAGATSMAGWAIAANADSAPTYLGGAGILLGGIALAAGPRRVRRLYAQWRRRPGMASAWQIWRANGSLAMRRRATVLRPALADRPWIDRWRVPLGTLATPLCRVGRLTVRTSVEESTLRIGIPGTGKSAEMGSKILDAPGAVVVTSTATDLYDATWRLREPAGTIHIFNPGGLACLKSTLNWRLLTGCEDPDTASRRAADLMGPPEEGEGKRWHIQAKEVLVGLLHAAALVGARMRDIQQWVADPDAALPLVLGYLKRSPRRDEMARQVANVFRMNQRTRDGVLLPLNPVLAWLSRPIAAECGDPGRGDAGLFDVRTFVDGRNTLYLLGDDDGTLAPLVGALTAEIAHQARHYAAVKTGGRLDPALTMILDEVALICPVPLDRWLSELRKRCIVIHAACQGLGQLRQRWGVNGASMILNSARAVLLYGGAKDVDDLAAFAKLAGDREDRDGDTARQVPVITTAELSQLPDHHVLVIRRGMPVALGMAPKVWRRRDVKKAKRATEKGRTETRGRNSAATEKAVRNPVRNPGTATSETPARGATQTRNPAGAARQ